MGIGYWGLSIGDWVLGIGYWGLEKLFLVCLVQRGGNKQPIQNQRNAYAVFILTSDF